MVRKTWTKADIKNLLYLYNKKVPLKIIGIIFNTTTNGVSKSLQRYSINHCHILDKQQSLIPDFIDNILKWIKNHYIFFKKIIENNDSLETKTIKINKILYQHRLNCLNKNQIENIIYKLRWNL